MINSKNGRVTGMIKPKVLLFSQRLEIAERFNAWAEANKVSKEPASFLAFLQGNHLINEEAAMLFIEAASENTNTSHTCEVQKDDLEKTIKSPHVLTLNEMSDSDLSDVWIEEKGGRIYHYPSAEWGKFLGLTLYCERPDGDTTAWFMNQYGIRWRRWSDSPTREQREATPWQS